MLQRGVSFPKALYREFTSFSSIATIQVGAKGGSINFLEQVVADSSSGQSQLLLPNRARAWLRPPG